MYPHGTILLYQIVAMENSSGIMSGASNTSNGTLEIPITMLLSGSGTYLVKVCNILCTNLYHEYQCKRACICSNFYS